MWLELPFQFFIICVNEVYVFRWTITVIFGIGGVVKVDPRIEAVCKIWEFEDLSSKTSVFIFRNLFILVDVAQLLQTSISFQENLELACRLLQKKRY